MAEKTGAAKKSLWPPLRIARLFTSLVLLLLLLPVIALWVAARIAFFYFVLKNSLARAGIPKSKAGRLARQAAFFFKKSV